MALNYRASLAGGPNDYLSEIGWRRQS